MNIGQLKTTFNHIILYINFLFLWFSQSNNAYIFCVVTMSKEFLAHNFYERYSCCRRTFYLTFTVIEFPFLLFCDIIFSPGPVLLHTWMSWRTHVLNYKQKLTIYFSQTRFLHCFKICSRISELALITKPYRTSQPPHQFMTTTTAFYYIQLLLQKQSITSTIDVYYIQL